MALALYFGLESCVFVYYSAWCSADLCNVTYHIRAQVMRRPSPYPPSPTRWALIAYYLFFA
jgi:hypothetical protein